MSDETDPADDKFPNLVGLELSDAEIFNIGRIVAYWGYIEHEVFEQALFALPDDAEIPKKLNNIQFSDVLESWKALVIDPARGERRAKLERTLSRILHYHDFRPGLVHGMWDWDSADPSVIISTRIAKRNVITARYTSKELAEMAQELGAILFELRYPGGLEEYAEKIAGVGSYVSRSFYAAMTGHPKAEELLPFGVQEALRKLRDETNGGSEGG